MGSLDICIPAAELVGLAVPEQPHRSRLACASDPQHVVVLSDRAKRNKLCAEQVGLHRTHIPLVRASRCMISVPAASQAISRSASSRTTVIGSMYGRPRGDLYRHRICVPGVQNSDSLATARAYRPSPAAAAGRHVLQDRGLPLLTSSDSRRALSAARHLHPDEGRVISRASSWPTRVWAGGRWSARAAVGGWVLRRLHGGGSLRIFCLTRYPRFPMVAVWSIGATIGSGPRIEARIRW